MILYGVALAIAVLTGIGIGARSKRHAQPPRENAILPQGGQGLEHRALGLGNAFWEAGRR